MFKGTLIISIEGDCQCMEQNRVSTSCSLIQNLGKEVRYGSG